MSAPDISVPRGMVACVIRALGRHPDIVVDRAAAASLHTSAYQRGIRLSRRRTYHRRFVRLSGLTRIGRAETYGTNKAAVAEIARAGAAVVACAEVAECLRVAARRMGLRLTVRKLGRGPYRKVEVRAA